MDKYQDALNKIKNMGEKDLYNERYLEYANVLQELVDILNEYNVTEENIRQILLGGNQAKELLCKATPKKPYLDNNSQLRCPICSEYTLRYFKRCCNCGTEIDWSE